MQGLVLSAVSGGHWSGRVCPTDKRGATVVGPSWLYGIPCAGYVAGGGPFARGRTIESLTSFGSDS